MEPLVVNLGLALAIGLLVGLERGWREREAPAGSRTAGIRTFGISGLLGGVMAALGAAAQNSLILPAGFLGFAAVFAWFKWRESVDDEDFSVTGVVVALAVFALGALAVSDRPTEAAAGGAALAAVLASREMLHGLLERLSWLEVRSALVLAVMTAVVLPLLPSEPIDPWGAINPREIWIFTILLGAFSYLGYILTRIAGPSRGMIYSTLAGSLVSSTAMTLSLARAEGSARRRAGAACLAAMVSILRVLAYSLFVAPAVMAIVLPAALAASAAFALSGWLLITRTPESEAAERSDRNPLEPKTIAISAALYAAMSLIGALSAKYLGSESLPITAAITGMADVDVAVLAMLRLQGGAIAAEILALAVLAAFASNALFRVISAATIAPPGFSMPLGIVTLLAIGLGFAVHMLVPALPLTFPNSALQ
jgi:uncharacterized membrane protein (DUF4010 family)